MKKDAFSRNLTQRNLPKNLISASVEAVVDFERHLITEEHSALETCSTRELEAYSAVLIREEKNTYDRYVAIARYGAFIGNDGLYAAVLALIDGAKVLDMLFQKLEESIGTERRDGILDGIEAPPLGLPSAGKAKLTGRVMDRMGEQLPASLYTELLREIRHGLPEDFRSEEREKFLAAGDIDTFIGASAEEFIARLKDHRVKGTLFFDQAITREVVAFVKSEPEIACAVRDGDTLYKTKIPYRAAEYLDATDPVMKRYYACHCPWARESIHSTLKTVSADFCHCSAGFVVQFWEKALDRKLEVDVLETVLGGDNRCRFAIRLPARF